MLRTSWEDRDHNLWLELDGELDHEDCLAVRDEFRERIAKGRGDVTIVMDGLTFMSSMGLGMLVKAATDMKADNRTMTLSGIRPNIRKVLESMQLLDVFAVA
jgi:anti-anti-sigma factor